MQKLTQIEKEIYASAINSLFGGSVQATPDQITLSITQDVDTMIQEISKCSKAVGSFAFEMFFDFLPTLKCGDSFCKTVKPDRKPKIVATARTTHRTS